MSKMSNINVSNNDMNEAGLYNEGLLPGRCPVVRYFPKKVFDAR